MKNNTVYILYAYKKPKESRLHSTKIQLKHLIYVCDFSVNGISDRNPRGLLFK